ncbi:Membrane-bound lysozyme-inhibitor of c-type lysozyme [Halomonas sp. THAF5a]|uniref:COG3650 family protein n=1 Tax=Halomonas sp. THAF5a TaxID=2587844 RepID=UPI0012689109|nr:MliC family protein [Halomonas sp. THAF5a]QFU03032.1 Membrane-bound lysozyme-inhibitor of c-type lysozyme [Halomonas sp. THAF5a]
MPRSASLRLALPLLMALGLSGCITVVSAPSPQPTSASPAANDTAPEDQAKDEAAPKAPLLPSTLFPGQADKLTAWRCTPAQDLVTAATEEELRLWSAQGGTRLAPAVVASGARYQQGDLSFWNKGREALVESQRGRLDCRVDVTHDALTRQAHPGVMFRGQGNEPGWYVELANDVPELTLSLDYGRREVTLPYRVTTLDNGAGRVILASGQAARPFTLRMEAKACFDSMSGRPWPARVTLSLNDKVYRGCGQGIAP